MNVTLDECFQFGLGAFETIGIEQGIPILLDKHLKRLERAADFLKLGSLSERGITARKIEKYLDDSIHKPINCKAGRKRSSHKYYHYREYVLHNFHRRCISGLCTCLLHLSL